MPTYQIWKPMQQNQNSKVCWLASFPSIHLPQSSNLIRLSNKKQFWEQKTENSTCVKSIVLLPIAIVLRLEASLVFQTRLRAIALNCKSLNKVYQNSSNYCKDILGFSIFPFLNKNTLSDCSIKMFSFYSFDWLAS